MARKGRRLPAQKRRELGLVRRGRAADDFDAAQAVEEALRPPGVDWWSPPRRG